MASPFWILGSLLGARAPGLTTRSKKLQVTKAIATCNKKLLRAPGIARLVLRAPGLATRSKKLQETKGIATSNKKLLGAPGIPTRSKDTFGGSWPYY